MAQEVAGSRPAPTKESIADWARATLEPMGGTVVVDRQFVEVELPAEKLRAAAHAISESDDPEFRLLYDISGLHWPDDGELEAVYHFFGGWHAEGITLRVRVPEDRPLIPTISEDWPTANWHEREAMDLFLFEFEGHPYPEPLLLEKDMQGALLKHYPQREAPDMVERFKQRGDVPFEIWKAVRPEIENG
jgi:NADH-quinone oxidoreductase subunit C